MTLSAFLALFPALIGLTAVQSAPAPGVRSLVAQDQIILRVPVRPRLAMPPIRWKERKGPKCMAIREIRAATLSGPAQVDFLLTERRRVRAKLTEGCPALDFYGGFYLKTGDEKVCAGRDAIRSRMGSSCQIDRFRKLVPRIDD